MKPMNDTRSFARSGLGLALAVVAASISISISIPVLAETAKPVGNEPLPPAPNQTDPPARERPELPEAPKEEKPIERVGQPPPAQDETTREAPAETSEHDADSTSPDEADQVSRAANEPRPETKSAGPEERREKPIDELEAPVDAGARAGGVRDNRAAVSAYPGSQVAARTPWGIEVGLGPLVAWVPDDSFDSFSDSGSWPALAARVGVSVWSNESFDVAASTAYHFAATSGAVRQSPTELSLHRFLVGGQGRYHLLPWLAPYGRVLAGLSYLTSRLGSGDEDEVPKLSSYDFSALASLGVQARILELTGTGVLVHLYVEGGGIFTSDTGLIYEVGSEGPPRSQPLDVGALSLTGPHLETGALARF